MKYGYLTIKEPIKDKFGMQKYICQCECGNIVEVYKNNLLSGKTRSCGCFRKQYFKQFFKRTNSYILEKEQNIAIGYTTNTNIPFVVDLEDYEKIKNISWYESSNGYIHHKDTNKHVIQLHRYITDAPSGFVVDHINHDNKDNRKNNLKICTQRENCNNRKEEPIGITKIKCNSNVYYVVQIKGKYKGCYKNYDMAKQIRDDIMCQMKGQL